MYIGRPSTSPDMSHHSISRSVLVLGELLGTGADAESTRGGVVQDLARAQGTVIEISLQLLYV